MLDEIFKKIQASQTTQPAANKRNENIFQMEKNNTYVVRLLPYMKKPENTFLTYHNHGWESRKNGKYISIPCLKTWGRQEQCPACEVRFAELKIGTEAAKAKARLLRQKTVHLVNVYIVESPKSEDVGKVKIMRYGAELDKVIKAAVNGEDAEEFGKRVFDLSVDGCDLRIKVDVKGVGKDAMPTYAASKFLSKKRDLGLSQNDIQGILSQAHDLTTLVPERLSNEKIEALLNEHYFTNQDRPAPVTYAKEPEEDDDTPFADEESPAIRNVSTSADDVSSEVDKLLEEFSIPTT